ncbi:TLR4 interactor with leucine rich repeats-like, partial [Pollicipes pollicipes]|uniref:TLR4 interactor with leucine rich repeats-like n=1 Tax=Pollicipes pollicipes TaxID=41117 RepID=UPI001884B9DF
VVRGLPRLPGRLFRGATLHGLLLSGSRAEHLPGDLLAGLENSLLALGLGENRLARVPTEALRPLVRLQRLSLSGNRLRAVEENELPPLPNLAELNLADNEIVRLAAGAFAALPSLTSLSLEGNRLDAQQLRGGALRRLDRLRQLTLDRNLLRGPLTPAVAAALPDVGVLSLARNNLTSTAAGALAALRSLTDLDLSRNSVDVIEDGSFVGLGRLRSLRLDGNRIVTLPAAAFRGLKRLASLDLGDNALLSVAPAVLAPLTGLRQLSLRHNDLIQLDGSMFDTMPSLKRLDLAENPLHCDCRLRELATYLAASRARLDAADLSQVTCTTPPELENAPLLEVMADQLTCADEQLPSAPEQPASADISQLVQLHSAELEAGGVVHLLWSVDPSLSPYRCRRVMAVELRAGFVRTRSSSEESFHSDSDDLDSLG